MNASMKKNSSPWAVAIISFLLGLGAFWGGQKLWQQSYNPKNSIADFDFNNLRDQSQFYDRFFSDDFFNRSNDPFKEMERMHNEMMRGSGIPEQGDGFFNSWFQKKFGAKSPAEISQREDDNFIYYDISIGNVDPKKLEVKVENGQVNISGEIEQKSEDSNMNTIYSSSFHRSFPAPENANSEKVEVERNGDGKITLKFPKA